MGTSNHMDLFLVRHGVTDWNQQKRYVGHTDRSLIQNELSTLKLLQKECNKIDFDRAYVSDLRRCQETFEYLQLQVEANTDPRLREMNFGDWEGRTYDELKDNEEYRNWLDNWEEHTIPNGDSPDDFKSRVDSILEDTFSEQMKNNSNKSKQILFVTHGGVIRYIVWKFQMSKSFWDFPIRHGQAIKLSFHLDKQKEVWQCTSLSAVPSQESENE